MAARAFAEADQDGSPGRATARVVAPTGVFSVG